MTDSQHTITNIRLASKHYDNFIWLNLTQFIPGTTLFKFHQNTRHNFKSRTYRRKISPPIRTRFEDHTTLFPWNRRGEIVFSMMLSPDMLSPWVRDGNKLISYLPRDLFRKSLAKELRRHWSHVVIFQLSLPKWKFSSFTPFTWTFFRIYLILITLAHYSRNISVIDP